MELDLLERCRAGDRGAYRALVAHWGDRILATATLLTRSPREAEVVTARAFVEAWTALPSLHSQRPFRPWLLARVLEAARATTPDIDEASAVAALRAVHGLGTMELALTLGWPLRHARRRAAQASTPSPEEQSLARVSIPSRFFDEGVLPRLKDEAVAEVRRLLPGDVDTAWGVVSDPLSMAVWPDVESVRPFPGALLTPGARATGKGHIAGRTRSRNTTLITRVEPPREGEPGILAWSVSSAVTRALRASIEFRWILEVALEDGATSLRLLLKQPAFPPGPLGRRLERTYSSLAGVMPVTMHRGIERLAATIETRAR